MLKNNKDPQASDNEKMDIETAKAIADLGKVAIEGYKVKAQVLNMMRNADNPTLMKETSVKGGFFDKEDVKFLDQG